LYVSRREAKLVVVWVKWIGFVGTPIFADWTGGGYVVAGGGSVCVVCIGVWKGREMAKG